MITVIRRKEPLMGKEISVRKVKETFLQEVER